MTKDLAICIAGTTNVDESQYLLTEPFMDAVAAQFERDFQGTSKL